MRSVICISAVMQTKVLLVIRSLLFYAGYFGVTIILSTLLIVVFPLVNDRTRYRMATWWCSFILYWLHLCCGVHYQLIGEENLPSGPVVILANHQSQWETILFYKLVFPVAPILKRELMNIPFWGWALRLQKPIAIDRSKPREAGKSLLIQGVDRVKHGYSIIIFPEGTRSQPGTLKRFSRGGARLAVAAGAPIVPIAHNAGDCWPARTFIKYPGLITVTIGSPISTCGASDSDLTAQVELWIKNQLRIDVLAGG